MHRLSWNFVWRTENMLVDYIQNLGKIRSGVMEKSAFHWLWMFISNFSLYFQLYSKFKMPSTQTVENYDNRFGIFKNLLSKCPSFSGKMTYFLANIVISSPSYSSLVNFTDYWTPCKYKVTEILGEKIRVEFSLFCANINDFNILVDVQTQFHVKPPLQNKRKAGVVSSL